VYSISSIGSAPQVAPVDWRGNRGDGAKPWPAPSGGAPSGGRNPTASGTSGGDAASLAPAGSKPLTAAEQRRVKELAQIDEGVRAHEAAHQAAAGSMGGAVSFSYETGPDGKSYAVGGEVPVDLSSGQTPEQTIARAQQVRAAALAPADPSPQDLSVAAAASQMEAMARTEMAQQKLAAQRSNADAKVPAVAPTDVGAKALATVSALQAERAASSASQIQVQNIARLAAAAYRM
jgi:hypothetical protein